MKILPHLLVRLVVAAALSVFTWRALEVWEGGGASVTLALLVLGELVTLAIYLTARLPTTVSFGPISILSTAAATFYALFIVLDGGAQLAPLWVTTVLQAFGIVWQIWAKLALGRSFGLLPANRGIVRRGPYSVVRHPIYLGYLVGHIGFLLADFGWRNLALLTVLYTFQLIRIREEERVLSGAEEYRTYRLHVRYRLVPGLF